MKFIIKHLSYSDHLNAIYIPDIEFFYTYNYDIKKILNYLNLSWGIYERSKIYCKINYYLININNNDITLFNIKKKILKIKNTEYRLYHIKEAICFDEFVYYNDIEFVDKETFNLLKNIKKSNLNYDDLKNEFILKTTLE